METLQHRTIEEVQKDFAQRVLLLSECEDKEKRDKAVLRATQEYIEECYFIL